MRTWKSLPFTLATAGACMLGAACGDDSSGDDDDDQHDATPIDAEPPPDMEVEPTATRAMTIAVTDVALTSTQGAAAGIKGGVVSIEFSDLTSGGGEVIFGTSPIGGCLVTKYDAAHPANPVLDAGPVTIGAPATGVNGVLKTLGPCAFANGTYTCASGTGTAQSMSGGASSTSAVAYTLTTQDFGGTDLVGSYIIANGFTGNASFNTGASPAPIVSQSGAMSNTLVAYKPGVTVGADTTTTGSFTILNAVAPIPTNGFPFAVDADFLGDENMAVRVQKAAHDNWPAIDFTVFPRGEAFELDNASAQPHAFPATGPVTFSCDGAGGDCGADTDSPPTGTLRAMIVSGRTTDVDVTGTPDYYMPAASAATEYTAFQCAFFALGANDAASVTLPADAVSAIMSVDVTRIETRVLRVAGTTLDGPTAEDAGLGKLLVGHGLIGHTTVVAP
jgi:hypothetical protein